MILVARKPLTARIFSRWRRRSRAHILIYCHVNCGFPRASSFPAQKSSRSQRLPKKLYGMTKARQAILTSLFCLSIGFLLAACEPVEEFVQYQFSGPTMGTQYNVSIVLEQGQKIHPDLEQLIDGKLAELNQSMSTYLPDSEVSLLNQQANREWQTVSKPLFEVLSTAQQISDLSKGAFDITVAPLVNLWGFGPETRESLKPNEEEIKQRLSQVGYKKLHLDSEQSAIRMDSPVSLDLSAVAKGYGADQVANLLLSLGYANFMVEIGGEIMVKGHSVRATPWRIGIEKPSSGRQGVQQAINISNVGVATSGDYRNYFEQDGQRFSHTINPVNGKPITHNLVSVTVITDKASEADALATAINVMGYEKGKKLAQDQQLAVYFIRKQGDRFVSDYTPHFKHYLDKG